MKKVCHEKVLGRWHARIGLFAVVFFVVLAASGIVLNHGGALGLEGRSVHLAWLARWYGFKTDALFSVFQAGDHVLASNNGTWVLDGAIVAENAPPAIGMVESGGALYVASADRLSVYAPDGRLIEKISGAALPATPITAIGGAEGRVSIRAGEGVFATPDSVSWVPDSGRHAMWSVPKPAPGSLQQILAARFVPPVPLLKLIADIHSGRIFGRYGPLIVDALALLLMILGLSGTWVFVRARHHARRARRGDS